MKSVLQQKAQDDDRQDEQSSILERTEQDAGERECCGIDLEHALDVRRVLDLVDAASQFCVPCIATLCDPGDRRTVDLVLHIRVRVRTDPVGAGRLDWSYFRTPCAHR